MDAHRAQGLHNCHHVCHHSAAHYFGLSMFPLSQWLGNGLDDRTEEHHDFGQVRFEAPRACAAPPSGCAAAPVGTALRRSARWRSNGSTRAGQREGWRTTVRLAAETTKTLSLLLPLLSQPRLQAEIPCRHRRRTKRLLMEIVMLMLSMKMMRRWELSNGRWKGSSTMRQKEAPPIAKESRRNQMMNPTTISESMRKASVTSIMLSASAHANRYPSFTLVHCARNCRSAPPG